MYFPSVFLLSFNNLAIRSLVTPITNKSNRTLAVLRNLEPPNAQSFPLPPANPPKMIPLQPHALQLTLHEWKLEANPRSGHAPAAFSNLRGRG